VEIFANVISINKTGFLTSFGLACNTAVYLNHKQIRKKMKTKSLFIAAIVMLSAAVTTFGMSKPGTSGLAVVPVKGQQVFKIVYKDENTGTVKINVANSSNVVVFAETLSDVDGFILPLNFNGLQYGEYTVTVTNAAGTKTEKLTYLPQITPASVIHVARVSGDSKYLVAVPAQGEQVVTVKIFDKSNNLLHDETKEVKGDFGQVYNAKNITGLTFEVTDSTGNTKTVSY